MKQVGPTTAAAARFVMWAVVGLLATPAMAAATMTPSATLGCAPQSGGMLLITEPPENKPAPGATVDFVPVSMIDMRTAAPDTDFISQPDPSGRHPVTRLVADAQGMITLPAMQAGAFVRATHGEFAAETTLTPGDTTEFKLKLDRAIIAQAVDDTGASLAGVPVILGQLNDGGFSERHRAVTEADGTARFPKPRSGRGRFWFGDDATSWKLTLGLPLFEPVMASVSLKDPPKTPVKLAVPATGKLTIKLKGRDGAPFTKPALVRVRRSVGQPAEDQLEWGDGGVVTSEAVAVNGVATFPRVALATTFFIQVDPADESLRSAHVLAAGPKLRNNEETIEVVCGGKGMRVGGKIVDLWGREAEYAVVTGTLDGFAEPDADGTSADHGSARATAGTTGRFTLRFDLDPADVKAAKIKLTAVHDYVTRDHSDLVFALPLPGNWANGFAILGDLGGPHGQRALPPKKKKQAEPEPEKESAGGHVMGDAGKPVVFAHLTVLQKKGDTWEALSGWEGMPYSTDKGAFDIYLKPGLRNLAITATSNGWCCPEPVPFEIGSHDITINLTKAGAFEGSLAPLGLSASARRGSSSMPWLPDDGTIIFSNMRITAAPSGGQVRVTAVRQPAAGAKAGKKPERIDIDLAGDRFRARSLLPGTYAVEFTVWGDDKPAVVVENVIVKAGDTNKDARLQKIDLSKKLVTRTVKVMDEGGRVLFGAEVAGHLVAPRSEWTSAFTTDEKGTAVIASTAPAIDLVVQKPGYRSAIIAGAKGDTDVKLKRADPMGITLTLDKLVTLPDSGVTVHARLVWLCDGAKADPKDPRTDSIFPQALGVSHKATFAVPDPGKYGVRLEIAGPGGDAGRTTTLDTDASVTVADGAPATVHVTVAQAAFDAAVKKVGG